MIPLREEEFKEWGELPDEEIVEVIRNHLKTKKKKSTNNFKNIKTL